ncbi:MAG TPA: LysM peptidoglycan-binding domain-containing protein [Candidatus Limnocylindrales bacterium]
MIDEPATSRSDPQPESPAGDASPVRAEMPVGTQPLDGPEVARPGGPVADPDPAVRAVAAGELVSVDHAALPLEPLDLATATRLALVDLPGRSPDLLVCPFLRGPDGASPPRLDGGVHQCAAVTPFVIVGDRQRALLCQVDAHETCPRYSRGEAVVRATLAPGLGRRGPGGPIAIGTALVLLVVAASVAVSSGLTPVGEPAPTVLAGGPAGSGDPGVASPGPTIDAGPATEAPAATLEPAPTVRPTLVATRDLPPAWRPLEPCPSPDRCYVYVVQRGDTLSGIAARFETTARRLRRLNPQLGSNTIRVRQEVRVPPPSD